MIWGTMHSWQQSRRGRRVQQVKQAIMVCRFQRGDWMACWGVARKGRDQPAGFFQVPSARALQEIEEWHPWRPWNPREEKALRL